MANSALTRVGLDLLARFVERKRVAAAFGRVTMTCLCVLLAGLSLLAALAYLCSAIWAFAEPSLGPAWASVVVAGVLAASALVLLFAAWVTTRPRRRRPPTLTTAPPLAAGEAEAILAMVETMYRANKAGALLAALVAGIAAEQSRKRE